MIGHALLPQTARDLRNAHPNLGFELVVREKPPDLVRRSVDLALTAVRPAQARAVASRVASIGLGLYAHSDWIDVHDFPGSADHLLSSPALIGEDRRGSSMERLRACGLAVHRGDFALLVDDDAAILAATDAALGVALQPGLAASSRPGLVRVLPDLGTAVDLWLAVHPDLRAVPHVRAVMDALRRQLTQAGDG